MTIASQSNIEALDYNSIRTKVLEVLGIGSGTYGYGQSLQSTPAVSGQIITKAQWEGLRYDIINIKVHQDGTTPSIVIPGAATGGVISPSAADAPTRYNTLIDLARTQRFNLGIGQFTLSSEGSATTSSAWSSTATATLTVTFSTADEARYFFNSGGKIRMYSTRTGGSATSQNTSWTNMLTTAAEQDFGADTHPTCSFYNLTNSYQQYYILSGSSAYAGNTFKLEAKCDVANNSAGTAKVVTLRATWQDLYTDPGTPAPGDQVDGTLTLFAQEIKASGTLQPSPAAGSFTITSPTYSFSTISTS